MPTGNEILSYQGNAALGIASDSGALGQFQSFKNEPILQTARDLALQSFAANQIIFKQKITDRNEAFSMLDDDKLILDNVLDEDRPLLDKKKKEIEDIFFKYSGDIYSDPKRFREFQSKIAEAKSHIIQGQKRYAWAKAEVDELKKSTSQYDVDKRKRFYNKELGKLQENFWAMPNPYAPVVDFDAEKVFQKPEYGAPVVTQVGDDDVTTQSVDVAKTFDKYQKTWADPKLREQFDNAIFGTEGEFGGFLTGPNAEKDIARVNAKLAELRAKGIQVDDLGVALNKVSGKYEATTDRPDQIAAKIALADSEATITTREFAKERVDAEVRRGTLKENIRSNKAGEAIDRTNAASTRMNAVTSRMNALKPDASAPGATSPESTGNLIYGINHKTSDGGQIANGVYVDKDGKVRNDYNGIQIIPASGLDNAIITEFNKYAGGQKVGSDGSVIEAVSPARLNGAGGKYRVRFKDGEVEAILTEDGTWATADQFKYITTQSSYKGVTKYKPAEDISGGKTGNTGAGPAKGKTETFKERAARIAAGG